MHNIFILTGPVGSGKTTRLLDWALKTDDVYGIATPVIRNNRMIFNISSLEVFAMEAEEHAVDKISIGKYDFNPYAFEKAVNIIEEAIRLDKGFIVIDEIGPLELQGHGFSKILKNILSNDKRNYNLVLVIRERLLEETLSHFGIVNYKMFKEIL